MIGISDEDYESAMEHLEDAKGDMANAIGALNQAESCETLADLKANIAEVIEHLVSAMLSAKLARHEAGGAK